MYIILLPRSSSWHFRAALLRGNQAKCQPGDRRTSDTSFTSNGSWPGTERHCRLGIANSFNGIVIVIFQVMYPYALSISQYVSCFNLTTCSRWTFKIKTIYSVWAVCWTQGALNLPPILWLLLVDLPQPDRSSCDTLPPQLWDDETNFALCCVFFLMNNADWMINLLQRISNICCIMTWRWCRRFYSTEWSKCSWTCNASLLNWNATNDDKCTSPSAA